MGTKIAIAQKRLFGDIFICKNCHQKMRTQAVRVIAGRVKCRKCGGRSLRAVRKK